VEGVGNVSRAQLLFSLFNKEKKRTNHQYVAQNNQTINAFKFIMKIASSRKPQKIN
jgi:hypothetical protein